MPLPSQRYYLLVLVLSQFAGTSVWFAGNAVLPELSKELGLAPSPALITSAVQIGFICGTLAFSLLAIADRFGATKIFLYCSLLAGGLNLSVLWLAQDNLSLYGLRSVTGFLLAGIYPVGMKIAADLFKENLGRAMGLLVGALVLGTAFPHLLQTVAHESAYTTVIVITSGLCVLGGIAVYWLLPASPARTAVEIQTSGLLALFRLPRFRAAAYGYFGHMWELYAFWAFVPFYIHWHRAHLGSALSVSLWSFAVIGSGALGCIIGGALSRKVGSMRVAKIALALSGTCCLLSPLMVASGDVLFGPFLLVWGIAVASDSPQFSTLVAQAVPLGIRGTALTLVTSIGFAITVVSLQMSAYTTSTFGNFGLLPLAAGPLLGLFATFRNQLRMESEDASYGVEK